MDAVLLQMMIYLAAAVLAVPLSRRLGLGSVLGYLAAGVAIGPVLGLVGRETEDVREFAEFGVVLMLFLIGLELRPRVLWDMRHRLLGLGGLQLVLTVAAIAPLAMAAGMRWNAALAVAMALALSSTAIVLQTLNERKLTHSEGGRASLAVLLFQDVAAVPLLAFMPLLALGAGPAGDAGPHGATLIGDVSPGLRAALVAAAVALVVLGGRFATPPVYRFLARARVPEIHVAGALLMIVAVSMLMSAIGLSPALGSFLAGVVLAGTSYRHQLEADLGPFKGLLLGLFFMTVGAGIDVGHLLAEPMRIVALTAALMLAKVAVLWALARLFRLRRPAAVLFTLALAQSGEFGFVLLDFAESSGVLTAAQANTALLVIAVSMLLTPALFWLQSGLDRRLADARARPPDPIDAPGTVIIAGMGRFGQTVNRILTAAGHRTVVLDNRPEVVERLRRLGIRGYYGEVDRPEVLVSAGIDGCRAVVVAIDEAEQAVRMVRQIRAGHPDLPVIARARDRHHVYELAAAGASVTVREVFAAAMDAGRHALAALGHRSAEVEAVVSAFATEDQRMLDELASVWRSDVPPERNARYLAMEREQAARIEAALQGAMAPRGGPVP